MDIFGTVRILQNNPFMINVINAVVLNFHVSTCLKLELVIISLALTWEMVDVCRNMVALSVAHVHPLVAVKE